jgi:hypothetical protein
VCMVMAVVHEMGVGGVSVWVDRQLQQEDWRPLGLEQLRSGAAGP